MRTVYIVNWHANPGEPVLEKKPTHAELAREAATRVWSNWASETALSWLERVEQARITGVRQQAERTDELLALANRDATLRACLMPWRAGHIPASEALTDAVLALVQEKEKYVAMLKMGCTQTGPHMHECGASAYMRYPVLASLSLSDWFRDMANVARQSAGRWIEDPKKRQAHRAEVVLQLELLAAIKWSEMASSPRPISPEDVNFGFWALLVPEVGHVDSKGAARGAVIADIAMLSNARILTGTFDGAIAAWERICGEFAGADLIEVKRDLHEQYALELRWLREMAGRR